MAVMGRVLFLALPGLAIAIANAQAPAPLTPEQMELLESTRESALRYSKSLPDFLCTEIIRRTEDPTNSNRWRNLDTLTVRVSYSGHEEYKLIRHDGRATDEEYESLAGTTSAGEFGTRLHDVFSPLSQASFAWKGWSRVRHRRVAVFNYRVSRERSRNEVRLSEKRVIAGYHGEISVDPESSTVIRITLNAELPAGFGIEACSSSTEYDYRDVAGRSFLLPVESNATLAMGRYRAANHIEFRDYRKFQTEATITFK